MTDGDHSPHRYPVAARAGAASRRRAATGTPVTARRDVLRCAVPALLGRDGVPLLLDLGLLAAQRAEVVQLRAAHVTARDDLDGLEARGVHRERALDTDAEADLADREGLADPAAAARDDDALEHLDPCARAFDDLDVHLEGVAGAEGRDVGPQRCGIDLVEGMHGVRFLALPQVRHVVEGAPLGGGPEGSWSGASGATHEACPGVVVAVSPVAETRPARTNEPVCHTGRAATNAGQSPWRVSTPSTTVQPCSARTSRSRASRPATSSPATRSDRLIAVRVSASSRRHRAIRPWCPDSRTSATSRSAHTGGLV